MSPEQKQALRRVAQAARKAADTQERLLAAIREADEAGCSVRQLEVASGLGKSTIQRWLNR